MVRYRNGRSILSLLRLVVAAPLMFVAVLPWSVAAQIAPVEDMEESTVRIIVAILNTVQGDTTAASTGTGFVLEDGHVATNSHVVVSEGELIQMLGGSPQDQQVIRKAFSSGTLRMLYLVIDGPSNLIDANVRWRSREIDLAVLKLAGNSDRSPVTLQREEHVDKGDDVIVMGFPGAADRHFTDQFAEPSLTKGTISRLVEDEHRTLYQVDAAINPGNSGGPLFNACGHVVGINVEKSLAQVYDSEGNTIRVTQGEGIGWSIRADELAAALSREGIPFQTATGPCIAAATLTSSGRDPLVLGLLAAALLLGVTAVGFSVTARGRTAVKKTVERVSERVSSRGGDRRLPAAYTAASTKPVLRGTAGPFRGQTFQLDGTPLTIGRDPRVSQLVFPPDAKGISKRHCILTYEKARSRFTIEDCWSTNGTFLASGKRIQPGTPHPLTAGSEFYLGVDANRFTVELKNG